MTLLKHWSTGSMMAHCALAGSINLTMAACLAWLSPLLELGTPWAAPILAVTGVTLYLNTFRLGGLCRFVSPTMLRGLLFMALTGLVAVLVASIGNAANMRGENLVMWLGWLGYVLLLLLEVRSRVQSALFS